MYPRALVALTGFVSSALALQPRFASAQQAPAGPYDAPAPVAPTAAPAPAAVAPAPAPAAPAPAPAVPAPMAPAPAAPAPAAAEEPSPLGFKRTASFFTRHEVREGYRDVGRSAGRFQEGQATVYRARLGLTTGPIDTGGPDVVLQFTPQASGWIGQTSTIVDYDLGLHEGYLRLQGKDGSYRFDVGRFIMNYGDALVIGNLGWHQTGRAFEGMRARLSLGKGWVDAFFTQLAEGRPLSDPLGAGDQYFYGVYAGVGPSVAKGMALDFYALGQTFPTTTGIEGTAFPQTRLSGTEVTLGARAKQKLGSFDYRGEAGIQFGTRPATGEATDVFSYQLDGELGLSPAKGLRFGLGGLIASGDDPTTDKNEAYNQLYPTAHKFLGLADVYGARSNVGSLNANLSFKALSNLVLKAQGHLMWTLESGDAESFTGAELDLHAIVPLGKGLKLRTMYALVPTSSDGILGSDGPVHYWETELSFALK